jgi:hypothetical protein
MISAKFRRFAQQLGIRVVRLIDAAVIVVRHDALLAMLFKSFVEPLDGSRRDAKYARYDGRSLVTLPTPKKSPSGLERIELVAYRPP